MKLLYDNQIFNMVNYGGISRYFYELMKGISHLGHSPKSTVLYSSNVYTKDNDFFDSREFLPNFNFRGKYLITKQLNHFHREYLIKKSDFDVFHPTYYDSCFIRKLKNKPFVVTFHDLIHEKFGETFPNQLRANTQFFEDRKELLKRASGIISISNNTKRDLIELYGVNPSKISVIHLANSLSTTALRKDRSLGDYILFVGVRRGYKNFDRFVSAIAPILTKESINLICAGGGEFDVDERALIQKLKIESRVIQVAIDDAQLAQLYHNALFFAFPSLYEGFGIPILEAFACGCPALLSNSSSFPEVAKDSAQFMESSDIDDIYEKVSLLITDSDLRTKLSLMGLNRLQEFSWDKTCQQTVQVYESAYENR